MSNAPKEIATSTEIHIYTWSDNKVRELATMCLPWQQWTETSVWLDDVGISAFHSYVVVDLSYVLFCNSYTTEIWQR
jgi:hypothetical protein